MDRGRRRSAAPVCHLLRARRASACPKSRSLGLARLARAVSRSRQRRRPPVRRGTQARDSFPRLAAMERGPATRRRPAARAPGGHAHRPLSRSGAGHRPLRIRPLGAPQVLRRRMPASVRRRTISRRPGRTGRSLRPIRGSTAKTVTGCTRSRSASRCGTAARCASIT